VRRALVAHWVVLLGVLSPLAVAANEGPRLAILSFGDEAGFQGTWDLSEDVPRSLADHLMALSSLRIIDADSARSAERAARDAGDSGIPLAAAVGRALNADYVLRGVVTACGVRRVVAGDPNLGGYRSFTYSVGLEQVELTRTTTASVVRTLSVVRDSVMRPLELNLFGRPTSHDKEFEALLKIDFGGEAFDELPFGHFIRGALDDLASDVVSTIYDRRPLILSREGARVLAVDEEQIFLGIGVDDYLEIGDVVPILDDEGHRVGLVEVVEMIGPHLSSANLLESAGDTENGVVELGQRFGQRLAPDAAAASTKKD